jgi:hypothetical protein
MDQSTDGKK